MPIDYKCALEFAYIGALEAERERGLGCCRVYITFSEEDGKGIAKAAKALQKAGMSSCIFQKKAYYGLSNALYVGYDNCDGKALAKATAMIAKLKEFGIVATREECGD